MSETYTVFRATTRIAAGTRAELARALGGLGPHPEGVLAFCDSTGRQVDLDLSVGPAPGDAPGDAPADAPAPRGRPRLGVTAREVTLLPRHWAWLGRQRGGASASLRRLIDAAIAGEDPGPARADAAFRFLTALAGDLAGYEAAIRALYRADAAGFAAAMAGWPDDVRAHARALAGL